MSGKDIRESVGLLLVVASMVFVGLEIRQNTRAIQATAIQNLTDSFREQMQLYINDPQLVGIMVRANETPGELSPEEAQRFFGYFVSGALTTQSAFRQWRLGVLPDEEWSVVRAVTCQDLTLPSFQELWPQVRGTLAPSFVAEIENSCVAAPTD